MPRRPKVRGVRKIFVTIEEDVAAILDKEQSVSLYVNEAIRYFMVAGINCRLSISYNQEPVAD